MNDVLSHLRTTGLARHPRLTSRLVTSSEPCRPTATVSGGRHGLAASGGRHGQAVAFGVVLIICSVLSGCDRGKATSPSAGATPAASAAELPSVDQALSTVDAPDPAAARRKTVESLPALESVLPEQSAGLAGLTEWAATLSQFAAEGKLPQVQAMCHGLAATESELRSVLGDAVADVEWPKYRRLSESLVGKAEEWINDLTQSGRKITAREITPSVDTYAKSASVRYLHSLVGGRMPVFELVFEHPENPDFHRSFHPFVYVNGQWRYLVNVPKPKAK